MNHHRRSRLACLLFSLLLGACAQIQPVAKLRAIQGQFDAASRQDNLAAVGHGTPSGYASVASQLSVDFIATLPDARLKANAWMMRAIAESRTARYNQALASAQNGLQAGPAPHMRDHILLTLVPALTIDTEAVAAWRATGKAFTLDQYKAHAETAYPTAFSHLRKAQALYGAETDDDTRHYVAFHQWRMLLNWDAMINRMTEEESVRDDAALRASASTCGPSLAKQARAARESIPVSSTYRALADSLSVTSP
ncbi:hypothetical protein [Prosthecobacter sp.]|uniref:hypothetical protein n=1 Tax=Prosthecobacter sp. TaxID=1965333 RepID=UPI002ABB6035|nr:hypothetical protein [Prosthecobacter sp.]MDZ4403640.1 hypothetical protein [Prosthecobacter sp.]